MFLLELVDTEGDETRPTVFFTDCGEAGHLLESAPDPLRLLTQGVFAQINSVLGGIATDIAKLGIPRWRQYRTRGGAYIPLVLRVGPRVYGFMPSLNDNPNRSEIGSAHSFLKANPGSVVFHLHRGRHFNIPMDRVFSIPVESLLV